MWPQKLSTSWMEEQEVIIKIFYLPCLQKRFSNFPDFIWLETFALWEDTEEYIDFMPATLPLRIWRHKDFALFVILLKKDIFLVEANQVAVKMLDSYSTLEVGFFKIIMHGGFLGEIVFLKARK